MENIGKKVPYKRLASLKRCDGDATKCLLDGDYGCCQDYSSTKSMRPTVLENVRKFLQKWKDKTAAKLEKDRIASRERALLNEEQKMRYKLEYHFMTPFEKYRKGRKPWKLAIQILKILVITIQVSLFATDRFAFVSFTQHTEDAFHHLFIQGWNDDVYYSYYSRQEVISAVQFANQRYLNISDVAIGTYWYSEGKKGLPTPMNFCVDYKVSKNGKSADKNIKQICQPMNSTFDVSSIISENSFFSKATKIQLKFQLNSVFLAGLRFLRRAENFTFNITLSLDNAKNDGRLPVSLTMSQTLTKSQQLQYKNDAKLVSGSLQAFDITVILVCMISCCLCVRSVFRSIRLAKKAKIYFEKYRSERLTRMDLYQLINKWFILIVISDCLSIVGSFYKLFIDEKDMNYYNLCSIVFGLAVLFVWVGLLRFLTYLKAYNILMITLRVAAPNLLRFISCVIFIFLGFSFCGWIVLGPFHVKFRTLLITMECLFSLLNGDDMYPTFGNVSNKAGIAVLIFSKLYLYFFISFFIYVVLSTFISIVGDTYERLKDWGRLPQTRIQRFIEGKRLDPHRQRNVHGECHRCLRTGMVNSTSHTSITNLDSSAERSFKSLSESQISVESASLE
eukprot:gene7716-8555_t